MDPETAMSLAAACSKLFLGGSMQTLVEDRTLQHPIGRHVEDASAARGPIAQFHSERVSIAPGFRLPIVLILAAFDILGAIAAVHALSPGAVTPQNLVSTAAILLLVVQICGLYAVEASADLQRSATGAIAFGLGLLPCAAAIGWIIEGWAAAWHMAYAVVCGAGTAAFGRLACGLAIQRLAGRMVERVLIIGKCQPGGRLVGSSYLLNERVKIIGQIVVGDGQPCVPLVGRIGADIEVGADMMAGFCNPMRGIDRVVILKTDLVDGQLTDIVRSLEALSVPITLLTNLSRVTDRPSSLPSGAEWIIHGTALKPGARLVKRGLDLLATLLLITLLAPILLLIALLIRLDSPGPALFRQVRLGRDNQPFTVFKFRTMRIDAPATDGSIQAVRGDKRITRMGAILRKTSLDELPQLLNVLNGTMSLVGPRPHPTELNRRYTSLIENYSARHRITPGITGWAQVNGFRGETATIEQMQRRVDHDLEYIRDHSVVFDLWILLRTVVAVIANRNAY